MSYSRRRLLRAPENLPIPLPQNVPKPKMMDKSRNNSTTAAPSESGDSRRHRTDKRFSDSDDLGLLSHVDDIEDVTHSFMFLSSRQTTKSSVTEIPSTTETPGSIYPWLNSTDINENETFLGTNKQDKRLNPKLSKEERRKARKKTKNKDLDINVNVGGRRNKWKRKRKERIRELCTGDFIGAQGKRCCQKSIKCFGDLPELLDEIESYNSSEDEDGLQRQHVCQHIKESMLCMGHAMALPVCKSSVTFVHRKLNDTLSDVTQFHDDSCQRATNSPPIIPTTTSSPPGGLGSQSGIKPHSHEHTNTAAIIGGVVGGAVLIFLIILIVLLLRRNKTKRPNQLSMKESDGGINLTNGSSRYKNHFGLSRKQSEVYAEIDESSMHSNQSLPDKRPLPTAPQNGTLSSDNTGYLTPRSSRGGSLANDTDSGGYHVLQKEPNRKPSVDAYEKLQNEEGEYIEPTNTSNSRVRIPSQKPPKNNNPDVPSGEDNYHMYFVLEKESVRV